MAYSKKYVIEGINPIAWKRAGLNGSVFYDQQKHDKLAVGTIMSRQHGNSRIFQGPLGLEMIFFGPIPKSSKIREPGDYISTTPDISNLQKFIEDVITDCHIYEDDKQIAKVFGVHIYSNNPRTVIRLTELTGEIDPELVAFLEELNEKP